MTRPSSREEALKQFELDLFEPEPSADERELLRRAAIPLIFDRKLVEQALASDLTELEPEWFERLVDANAIESVPASQELFRMRARERATHLQSFRSLEHPTGTPDLRALSARLVEALAQRGSAWALEHLRHLLLLEPERALKELEARWTSAEERFELTELQDLLDVVGERLIFADPRLSALESRFKLRLRARGMWLDEWYRTSRLFERETIRTFAAALLGPESSTSILQLYARGGMGKTMFVRWLLARYCVPRGIPCARIDFDYDDAFELANAPWRLVLRFAAQLDPQIEGGALSRVLAMGRELEDIAAQRASSPTGMNESFRRELDEKVFDAFAYSLSAARADQPVLLVFDTTEEALRGGAVVFDLLRTVIGLRTGEGGRPPCPALRIILAGRFDLRKKMDGFAAFVGSAARHEELGPFAPAETEEFLCEGRELPLSPELARQVGKNLGNVPFKLALAADLIEVGAVKPENIGEASELDVVWLTERVLLRIRKNEPGSEPVADAEVRWLLRYGCVPRRLTRALVRDVIMRYLPDAVAGVADYDSGKDELPEELLHHELFPTVRERSEVSEQAIDELWERLSSYAGTYATAWVWFVGEQRDTLLFQKDVSQPMRRLLAKHPVYARLHADLVDYFEALAAREPEHWAQFTREAVYHRFQLEGAAAEPYLQSKLEEAEARGGEEARFEIVDELVGPATHNDYVDDEGYPRALRDATKDAPAMRMISDETLARVWMERAVLGVKRATRASRNEVLEWKGVDSALAAFDRIRAGVAFPGQLVLDARRNYVAGALALNRGEPADALACAEAAWPELTGGERTRALLLRADAFRHLFEFEDAAAAYRGVASELEAESPRPLALILAAQYWLAFSEAESGRLEFASRECLRALDLYRQQASEPDSAIVGQLFDLLGSCLLALGLPLSTVQLPELPVGLHPIGVRFLLQRARSLAKEGDLSDAARTLARAQELFDHDLAQNVNDHAALEEAKGIVHSLRLDFAAATKGFDQAIELWGSVSRDATVRCLSRSIGFQLREIGSVKHAHRLLSDAQRVTLHPRSPLRFVLACLRMEVEARHRELPPIGERTRRFRELDALWAAAAGFPPNVTVPLALAEIRFRGESDQVWKRLCDELERVFSVFERLTLLAPVEQIAAATSIPHASRARLRALFGVEDVTKTFQTMSRLPLTSLDFAVPRLRLAEVLRFIGEPEEAARLLTSLEEYAHQQRRPALYRRVLIARDRLGSPEFALRVDRDRLRELGELSPELLRAAWIEHAERLIRAGRTDLANSVMAECANVEGRALTHWEARMMIVRADLVKGHSVEQAEAALAAARVVYTELEDGAAKRSLDQRRLERAPTVATYRGGGPEPSRQSPSPGRLSDLETTLRVVLGRIDTDLTLAVHLGERVIAPNARIDWFPETKLGMFPADGSSQYSRALLNVLTNQPEVFVHGIESVLVPWVTESERSGPLARVCIESADASVQAAPWELVQGTHEMLRALTVYRLHEAKRQATESARWVQSALNRVLGQKIFADGVFGPQSRAAIAELQRHSGLAPSGHWDTPTRGALLTATRALLKERGPRAVLLLPSRAFIESHRFRHTPTIELEHRLQKSCSEVVLVGLDELESGEKIARLEADPPSLVFLRGQMRESSTRGGVAIDLVSDERMQEAVSGSARLTVSTLDRALVAFGARGLAPTVMLEVAPSTSLHEEMVQLLLRNYFAAELFALGGPLGVIAGGFYDPLHESAMLEEFERGLGAGSSLGDLTRELRDRATHMATPEPFSRAALRAVALFTHEPGFPAVSPRRRP